MAGRLLSNELFTLQILCYTASYRGDKALERSGRGSLMSTSHLDSEVDTDLEEVGHDMDRNTAPHHDSKGSKQNKMNNLSTA